jgi:hypothetical protein
MNAGPGRPFVERTTEVFGPTPDLARVIKARDLNNDGLTDIVVATTYQTQSRLYLGTGGGAFREVTSTHLPQQVASVGDIEIGDVDADGDLDLVLADWGAGNNMTNDGGRTRLWLNDGAGRFTDATAQMPELLIDVAHLARRIHVGELASRLFGALLQRFRRESRETQTTHLAIDEPELLLHAALLGGLQRCRPVLPLRRIHEIPSPFALDNMRIRIDYHRLSVGRHG